MDDEPEIITEKMCVACESGNGPDLFFCLVRCRSDQYEHGDHYVAAEELAKDEGYDGPMVAFDEHDPPGDNLMRLFEWQTIKAPHDITDNTRLAE